MEAASSRLPIGTSDIGVESDFSGPKAPRILTWARKEADLTWAVNWALMGRAPTGIQLYGAHLFCVTRRYLIKVQRLSLFFFVCLFAVLFVFFVG